MAGFQFTYRNNGDLLEWEGDPDDDSAHLTVLGWLQSAVTTGFVPASNSLSNRIKGNLGEFIAHKVGESYVFTNQNIAFTANAWDPLSDISRPDLDIVWLHFGTTPADDWAAIQEVKTTGQSTLVLADDLIQDYEKLFAENPRFTLRTRACLQTPKVISINRFRQDRSITAKPQTRVGGRAQMVKSGRFCPRAIVCKHALG